MRSSLASAVAGKTQQHARRRPARPPLPALRPPRALPAARPARCAPRPASRPRARGAGPPDRSAAASHKHKPRSLLEHHGRPIFCLKFNGCDPAYKGLLATVGKNRVRARSTRAGDKARARRPALTRGARRAPARYVGYAPNPGSCARVAPARSPAARSASRRRAPQRCNPGPLPGPGRPAAAPPPHPPPAPPAAPRRPSGERVPVPPGRPRGGGADIHRRRREARPCALL